MAALREGAYDYVTKPIDAEGFTLGVVRRLADERAARAELDQARELLEGLAGSIPTVGCTPQIARLLDRLDTFAGSSAPVLITGESGTGKELVARTLHQKSARRDKPFVAVNCAAFPDSLLEAELFGHERGAFTGAVKRRDGRFKAADGGTILLDEVAEIPLLGQAKLLRVLQEGTVEPLGANTVVGVDVRVISATHQNLKELIARGRFREDLYYRLNVLDLHIPPLRERRADIPLLLQHFLRQSAPPGALPQVSPRAWAALADYPFPGNVRELAHAVEHAVVLSHGQEIELEHLPPDIAGKALAEGQTPAAIPLLAAAMRAFERDYLVRALGLTGGRRDRTAELLGISRKTLWEKLRLHGITGDDVPPERGAAGPWSRTVHPERGAVRAGTPAGACARPPAGRRVHRRWSPAPRAGGCCRAGWGG
ncbi:MAG: sigma-54 interaction domain-containing protein [Myxococcaceae bacterium]